MKLRSACRMGPLAPAVAGGGRSRSARSLLGAVAVTAALGAPAGEQALTLSEAERAALEGEPGTIALLERAAAFDELATAAQALPDPVVRFGAANLPLESGGFRTEGMTQGQLAIRQALPPNTLRTATGHRERARGDEQRARAKARRRWVLREVRGAWLDVFVQTRRQAIVRDSRALFADLLTVTRSLYTVGGKNQQDVLRAELELSHLDARLLAVEQRLAEARAELFRWVGEAATAPVGDWPGWPVPPGLVELRGALARHPELAAAGARIAIADAGVALAKSRFRPTWTVDAAYGYRDGGMASGESRSDVLSVNATLSAPLFTARRQRRGLAAAQGQRRAAALQEDELRARLDSALTLAHRRWATLGQRIDLYEGALLPQARGNAEAALAAYRSDAADFADVMRSHINDLEMRLEHLALRVDRLRSHTQLAYFGGIAP